RGVFDLLADFGLQWLGILNRLGDGAHVRRLARPCKSWPTTALHATRLSASGAHHAASAHHAAASAHHAAAGLTHHAGLRSVSATAPTHPGRRCDGRILRTLVRITVDQPNN